MKNKESSKIKITVITGYALVVMVMVIGLLAVYHNLVDFSNKKMKNEDLSGMLIVGNTLSKLYDIESGQNLFTAESAQQYFLRYDSIVPEIQQNLDSLQQLSQDPARVSKIDTIKFLIDGKKENLQAMAILLDSIGKAPRVNLQIESRYIPKELNREITDYLESKNMTTPDRNANDTSVVRGQRRGFLDRVRDVFVASQDSTIVIESKSVITENDYRLIVDTIIHKVRYSEKLDLERQKQFQLALIRRQAEMSHTNRMLTARIDELLKGIEQEELRKSLQLIIDKEHALSGSQNSMLLVSTIALLIASLFALLFLLDINKSQRYRRQLEVSNKRITDLLASREKLMLTISHDIKAPVSSILGYIELMDSRVDEKKRAAWLHNMRLSGEHVMQLVSTLLDFHQLEAGTWQLKESNFNVHHLVQDTVSSFKPLAVHKGLAYVVENRLREEMTAFGDPYVIRQVMGNIISNAIKYTAKGKIVITAGEEVRDSFNWLILSVSDTGTGIDISDQQLIFREFHRLEEDAGTNRHIEGTGLGLAITKGFVDELHGQIHLISEKGEGSEFTVELPLQPEQKGDDNVTGEHAADPEDITVLLVDDDPVQLMMLSEMLHRKKINCVVESNPDNVMNLLSERAFDMLFLDIQMPRINGMALAEKVRRMHEGKEMPVIALSARSDLSPANIQAAGFTDFLAKPFSSNELYRFIDRYVKKNNRTTEFQPDTQQPAGTNGVEALIAFIRDDKAASRGILQSFIDETTENRIQLETALTQKNLQKAGHLSHKMLPLFRMMGDPSAIDIMEQLEDRQRLSENEEAAILEMIKKSVDEATALIKEMEKE